MRSRPRSRSRCARGKVKVEGDLDFRGTLGVAKDAAVGFTASGSASSSTATPARSSCATLLKLTERYCVVYQTLRNPPPVSVGR